MTLEDPNIGQTGPESVRLRGVKIEDLPLGQGNEAVAQVPLLYASERANKVSAIKARYSKATVLYLQSRVKECHENITRTHDFKTGIATQMQEYNGLIAICGHRDKQLAGVTADTTLDTAAKSERIKELKKQFPLYDVAAMRQQITQFETSITKADAVVQQEYDSINELTAVIQQ